LVISAPNSSASTWPAVMPNTKRGAYESEAMHSFGDALVKALPVLSR